MKFAHNSEKIFSEHLDLFDIKWLYEPTSFPLKWDSGSIKMMFTPDFYLPELNIYVEITTMNQKLIELDFNISLNTDNRLMSNTSVNFELENCKLIGINKTESLLNFLANFNFFCFFVIKF